MEEIDQRQLRKLPINKLVALKHSKSDPISAELADMEIRRRWDARIYRRSFIAPNVVAILTLLLTLHNSWDKIKAFLSSAFSF